jgi:hypothetical protein
MGSLARRRKLYMNNNNNNNKKGKAQVTGRLRHKQQNRLILNITRGKSVPVLNYWWHTLAYWIRHHATSRNVAGSRPDEVKEFNVLHPSGRTRPWGLLGL